MPPETLPGFAPDESGDDIPALLRRLRQTRCRLGLLRAAGRLSRHTDLNRRRAARGHTAEPLVLPPSEAAALHCALHLTLRLLQGH